MTIEQQRLIAMLEYLQEWDKLDRVPAFDVAAHQGAFLAWQHDVEELPAFTSMSLMSPEKCGSTLSASDRESLPKYRRNSSSGSL